MRDNEVSFDVSALLSVIRKIVILIEDTVESVIIDFIDPYPEDLVSSSSVVSLAVSRDSSQVAHLNTDADNFF